MRIMFDKKIGLLLLLLKISAVSAQNISIPMDLVKWEYKGDQFQCLLNQNVNKFRQLTFIAEPNDKLTLKVENSQILKHIDSASLYISDAPWAVENKPVLIGTGQVAAPHVLTFDQSVGELLRAMSNGKWGQYVISYRSQSEPVSVELPSIRITEPLNQFNRCRSSLPAMSYKQARDMVLSFELGQRVVDKRQKHSLVQLADYVKADKKVRNILIDGHTDNVGPSLANLQISKVRADDVASILEEAGVKPSLLEVRSHGSRYPVAGNTTDEGKALNRRVTVRVIRSAPNEESKVH